VLQTKPTFKASSEDESGLLFFDVVKQQLRKQPVKPFKSDYAGASIPNLCFHYSFYFRAESMKYTKTRNF